MKTNTALARAMAQLGEAPANAMEVDPQPTDEAATRESSPPAERIPPLTNFVPSLFVPLEDDITQPGDIPRTRVERLKRIIETIDSQRAGVRENMMYLFERERDRIRIDAWEQELAEGEPESRAGLPPDEVDWMIGNMEAPHQPDLDYNIRDMPPRATGRQVPGMTPREKTADRLFDLVEQAVAETQGYDKHMGDIRNYYVSMLDRERKKIDEIGKRPEERSKGAP